MVTGVDQAERADDGGTRLRAGLAAALKNAIRTRDPVAASALRTERLHTEAAILTSVISAGDLDG
jgi:hypothetical protein